MDTQELYLIGRATADAESKTSKDGDTTWAQFNVAVNQKFGDKEFTTFFRVKVWNESQEQVIEYVKKGCRLIIKGRPEANCYTSEKSGKEVKSIEVHAWYWNVVGYPRESSEKSEDL